MNEIARIDKNLSVERTPEVIAVEINNITETLRKIFLLNAIEIGRRLAEAKIMVGHGEWGNWLRKSFDYSQRTASDFMLVFEQYGSSQMVIFCDNVKSQAFANLNVTQAILLARGIPADEREKFIENNDINSMSTRELQQAIKDKQELEAKLREVEAGWEGTKKIADKAKQKVKEKEEEVSRLEASIAETNKLLTEAQASGNTGEVERLSESLVKTDSELYFAHQKIEELERQLKEPIEVTAADVVEKVPEEVEKELNELRERTKELEAKVAQQQGNITTTASDRANAHLDSIIKGFKGLLSSLAEINEIEEHERYKNAVVKLIGKMSEHL